MLAQQETGPQSDQFYSGILARSGLKILERMDVELTGDQIAETVIAAVGDGCGSCRERRLLIFTGTRMLADLELDEPVATPDVGVGLTISQPVRLPDEPSCCPSASYTLQFAYDPSVRQRAGVEVAGHFAFTPTVAIQPTGTAEATPLHSVAVYYALLADGHYEQAYELLSESYRRESYYPLWLKAQIDAGVPLMTQAMQEPGTPSDIRVQIEEVEPQSGALKQVQSGVWHTEPAEGTWRLGQFVPAVG